MLLVAVEEAQQTYCAQDKCTEGAAEEFDEALKHGHVRRVRLGGSRLFLLFLVVHSLFDRRKQRLTDHVIMNRLHASLNVPLA